MGHGFTGRTPEAPSAPGRWDEMAAKFRDWASARRGGSWCLAHLPPVAPLCLSPSLQKPYSHFAAPPSLAGLTRTKLLRQHTHARRSPRPATEAPCDARLLLSVPRWWRDGISTYLFKTLGGATVPAHGGGGGSFHAPTWTSSLGAPRLLLRRATRLETCAAGVVRRPRPETFLAALTTRWLGLLRLVPKKSWKTNTTQR